MPILVSVFPLLILTASLATAQPQALGLPTYTPRVGSPGFSADCAGTLKMAQSLEEEAYSCERAEDCRFWPCNTYAIGSSPAADRYIEARVWLVQHCGHRLLYALGYGSTAVCENGKCDAKPNE